MTKIFILERSKDMSFGGQKIMVLVVFMIFVLLGCDQGVGKILPFQKSGEALYTEKCGSGLAKYIRGNYEGALQDLHEGVELCPEDTEAYLWRGLVRRHLGNYADALQDYSKVIELEPEKANGYSGRAEVKHYLKDYLGAVQDYDRAIEIDSKSSNLYYARGLAKNDFKDYTGAVQDFNKAVELNPKDNLCRGLVSYILKDYDGAISFFDKTIQDEDIYDGNEPYAYFWRGQAKYMLGDKMGALNDLSSAGEWGKKDAYEHIQKIQEEL